MRAKSHRGGGLVLKFSLLMSVLVILIVAGVAVSLLWQMIPRERRMLAEGLRNRAGILLESVALRAAVPIRTGSSGLAAVSALPAEISTMPGEAVSLTISGPGNPERPGIPDTEDPLDRDYLWATNDQSLSGTSFTFGISPVSDARLDRDEVREMARRVNAAAAEKLQGVVDEAAKQKVLQELAAAEQGTAPAFDPEAIESSSTYLFYRPLVAEDEEGGYFAGMVRLYITTGKVEAQLTEAMNTMASMAGLVALIAVAVGVAGAVLLANIAIRPIGRLVKAVSTVRNTEDKSKLQEIPVGARDEIGTLAETVNEMIEGLVTAAIAEKQMLLGRQIQKQFLPFQPGADGEKGSTGGVRNADIDLYAYYEGATKVSGDYFDWQKLDERYYAIMKCDVSGHGVEAAFIMVEVATLFHRWCRERRDRLPGLAAQRDAKEQERGRGELLKLDTLVYTINDMIVERGFKGKFAAFMLCLYDVRTGIVTACSAGDNVLHRYDAAAGRTVTQQLEPRSPAVGQIDSDMIAMGHGYPSRQLKLASRDVLVLFTDGFEESKRHFRDGSGAMTACADPAHLDKSKDPRSTHKTDDGGEEMSVHRILEIFDAFFNKKGYRLERHHVAQPEELEFDFSGCSDSLEEAVLALVAVERVYRTYRDPQTGPQDRIVVENKVDQYLRKHFKQYEKYFGPQPSADNSSEYVTISNVKEDVQEDDLTVVLLRRP